MKATNCTRCGWPLDPAAARGGHTRHPNCDPADQLGGQSAMAAPDTEPEPATREDRP